MEDKVLSLLGLCRKAGKISLGHNQSISAIKGKKARLCLLSTDLSERAKKEFEHARENLSDGSVEFINTRYSMDDIQGSTGSRAGVLTIDDEGLAKKIAELLRNTTGEE